MLRKIVLITIAALLLVIGIGVWFWSLGRLPATPGKAMTLRVESPSVSVRSPGSNDWQAATDGMTIGAGWTVKTEEGGRATIRVAETGESRLAPNSELTVSEAAFESGNRATVSLSLAGGRVWTRVLRFFDLGSSYSVKTNAVVATVRGTAFDVRVTPERKTEVAVYGAAVDVAPQQSGDAATPEAIAVGSVALFGSDGKTEGRRQIQESDRTTEWVVQNSNADEAFMTSAVSKRVAELRALGGVRPGSALTGIVALSEQTHLALADAAERERIAERYAERRLMQILTLISEGKSGQAAQEFAKLENDMKSQTTGADERARIRQALAVIAPIIETAGTESPLFGFRQRFETLVQSVSDPNGASGVFARLIAVEDRIDEAERYIASRALEEARIALDGAKSGVENVSRESQPLLAGFALADRRAVEGRIAALRARESAARIRLEQALTDAPATSTDALPESGTTSTDTLPPETASTGTPPDASAFVSIRVTVTPNPLVIGKTATIRVIGTRADGSTSDVSAVTTFANTDESVAHLNGLEITGVAEGTTTVTAAYPTADGTALTQRASIRVTAPVIPVSLSLTASNGTALALGGSTVFTATVRYNNGTQRVVTGNTAFILESGSIGSLSGATFMSPIAGSATVTASYTENGKSVQTTISLTVAHAASNTGSSTAP